jgi:hypothetical protein
MLKQRLDTEWRRRFMPDPSPKGCRELASNKIGEALSEGAVN